MEIENIPISEIIPYDKNPRKNEEAVKIVMKSIKEFGFKVPIILDKNNTIIAGHTRLKAAIRLGITTIPVIRADELTEAQVKAFRIMDNKSSEFAEWNLGLLQDEMDFLKDEGFDLDLTGFDDGELSDLINMMDAKPDYEFEELDKNIFKTANVIIGYLRGKLTQKTFEEFVGVYNFFLKKHKTMDDVFKEIIKKCRN